MDRLTYPPIALDRPGFRLFRLFKGQFSSSFAGELFLAYLDRADDIVPFEALSYTWGHPEPVDHVTVNGGRLSIANNLSIALPYLRREDRDRILWIDAICIDQDDKKERGHQVQQMGKIFSQADTVVCWLGPATNDTNLVMSNLRLLQQESVRRGHRHLNDSWSSIQRAWADRHDDHNYDKLQSQSPVRQCAGMRLLLESNWFKRVWILQEVANASRAQVQCGSQSVSSRVFSTAPTLLGITPSDHCQAVLDIMPGPLRQGSWYSQQRDLYSLLKHFRGSEALEPRDKIYALLGICSDAEDGDRLLQPDYSKPIGQVIDDAIQHMYAVDMRGEIGYSDMECFLTNLEFINATALSSLARWTTRLGDFERLVQRVQQTTASTKDIIKIWQGAVTSNHGAAFLELLIRYQVPVPTRAILEYIRDGMAAKGCAGAVLQHLLERPETGFRGKLHAIELIRLSTRNSCTRMVVKCLLQKQGTWTGTPYDAVVSLPSRAGYMHAGHADRMLLDLPGRYKTWVEAIGDMMTIAIRKHNDGGFHFDTLDLLARRVFKSMGVENSTQRELWVFKLAAVARMVAEEDENEVSNLFLRQHQLWIPMEEKMNKMAMSRDFDPAIRLDPTLWAPVIEKVADSVAGATCWGLLYHVLQQQQSWVPPLQDVARASGRESITRLLVEQQRLWCLIAREVDEAEGAGEPGAGALIGLMYAQQRSWLPILDELDQIELPDTKLFHQSPDLWASILDDLRHVW